MMQRAAEAVNHQDRGALPPFDIVDTVSFYGHEAAERRHGAFGSAGYASRLEEEPTGDEKNRGGDGDHDA
jgi:hypothetical protein